MYVLCLCNGYSYLSYFFYVNILAKSYDGLIV